MIFPQVDKLANQQAGGRNILHYAAASGSSEMFEAVLKVLDSEQVDLPETWPY